MHRLTWTATGSLRAGRRRAAFARTRRTGARCQIDETNFFAHLRFRRRGWCYGNDRLRRGRRNDRSRFRNFSSGRGGGFGDDFFCNHRFRFRLDFHDGFRFGFRRVNDDDFFFDDGLGFFYDWLGCEPRGDFGMIFY